METHHQQGTGGEVPLADIDRLRGLSAEAEKLGRLTAEQLEIIYDRRWFKLFVPADLGGLGLTLPEAVRLEEELAGIDGSLGWTVTLCAGANWFVGFMDQSIAEAIFSDAVVCLGGSGQASGRAVIDNGGYRVSGKWRYATGTPHLTHFTANCILQESGEIQSFFFPKDAVRVIEDWNAFGLKATASHAFEVEDLWVDKTHVFSIAPDAVRLDDPVYRYPFLQFAEATLAVNTLGMAQHFVACAGAMGAAVTPEMAAAASAEIGKNKVLFYEALEASWDELVNKDLPSPETLEAVSDHSRNLVRSSREQAVKLYPHVGLVAADCSSEINRIWRDLFTASQHSLLRA